MTDRARRFVGILVAALAVSSCAELGLPMVGGIPGTTLAPPKVTFAGARLARAPSQQALAAYYCPGLVTGPFGAGAFVCRQAFGPRPAPAALTVAFDLSFHVENPNKIPLPFASALVATTLFPATTGEKLGAVCVSLCPDGAAGCTGEAPPGACEASSRDVRSLNDFANNVLPQLLISNGLALATGGAPQFTLPPVAASGQADVTVRYAFGPEQLLSVMRQLAEQSVDELKAGRAPTFTIPYKLEGTVWFDGGSVGRIAVGWGPASGTWTLPVEGLL